jgi:hypothetical protein
MSAPQTQPTIYRQLWAEIHEYAVRYPNHPCKKARREAKEFYRSVLDRLPCKTCREHYAEHLRCLCVKNRCHLFRWTVNTHNKVNALLGKPIVSLDEAACMYGLV